MKLLLVACFAIFAVSSGSIPAVSQWTLQELSEAIQDPNVDPLVLPYLEEALDNMMLALWHGVDQSIATVVLPASVVEAIAAQAVEDAPAPVATETVVQSSPLVRIILNINAGSASSVLPEATPIIPAAVDQVVIPEIEAVAQLPEVVAVAEIVPEVVAVAEIVPEVVAVAEIVPEVVAVAEIVPEVVAVAETVPGPVAMPIGVVSPINPIDAVAIAAVEVNPIDILAPVQAVGDVGGILV